MGGYVELFGDIFSLRVRISTWYAHPAPKVYPAPKSISVFESPQKRLLNKFLNYSFLIFTKFYMFTA
jgi:hypothetical protein